MVQERSNLTSPRKKERNSMRSKKKESIFNMFSRKQTPREETNLEVAKRHGYTLYTNENRKSKTTYLHKNKSGRSVRSKLPPRPSAPPPPRFSTFTRLAPENPPRGRVHLRPRPRSVCYQLTLNKKNIMDKLKLTQEKYNRKCSHLGAERKRAAL